MVKLSKQVLERQIRPEYHYMDDGDTLENLVAKYGPDAYLDIVWDYSDTSIRIVVNHEETDEQYNARIEVYKAAARAEAEKKKQAKAKKEASERALYDKLKEKYGD